MRLLSILISILLFLPSNLTGETISIRLSGDMTKDSAGPLLRQALNSYETSMETVLTDRWTRLALNEGETIDLGNGHLLTLLEPQSTRPQILAIGPDGPERSSLQSGQETDLGFISILLLNSRNAGRTAEFMMKSNNSTPPLMERKAGRSSQTEILGYDEPARLEVKSDSDEIREFSKIFIRNLNAGLTPEQAAITARAHVPPPSGPVSVQSPLLRQQSPQQTRSYVDPTNIFENPGADGPMSAFITLYLVQGDSSAIQSLNSSFDYQSDGRNPDRTRVGASGGPGGGSLDIGRPGDRFSARIRALEASGSIQSRSETSLRVPLGGNGQISLSSPRGILYANMNVRPRGPQHVELLLNQTTGDWGFLGSVSTRVRVRDGGQVMLARNTYRRTTSASSGVPIISGIPWIGPVIGSSESTQQESTYALFATVSID